MAQLKNDRVLEERDAMADPTEFLDDVVDDGRGDGMKGGDLREVKGESASIGDGAWVFDGADRSPIRLALAQLHLANFGLDAFILPLAMER
nr:hypothetical protein CFP56_45037 [Quercus suber]